jgi:hypothetical protein
MKTKLLNGGSLFAETHFSIGIGIGTPYYAPPPPPVIVYALPCPGPEYKLDHSSTPIFTVNA